MSVARAAIEANLAHVRQRMADAAERAGRSPETVRLIAVTKTVGVEAITILRSLGVSEFGENRVEAAQPKIESIGPGVCWHMIGSVQRRKARDVVQWFDRVDSVDRVELAEALERRCDELDRALSVLVEVNVSGEASKHGLEPGDIANVLRQMRTYERLKVEGLMTMAPFVDDPEEIRPVFRRLSALARDLGLPEVSMGMSNDFEVAIEEGATQVRVGTSLFCEHAL